MNALFLLLPVSLLLAGTFLWLFVLAARDGQFEDLDDPGPRLTHDPD